VIGTQYSVGAFPDSPVGISLPPDLNVEWATLADHLISSTINGGRGSLIIDRSNLSLGMVACLPEADWFDQRV
jgi:hypothetical protein